MMVCIGISLGVEPDFVYSNVRAHGSFVKIPSSSSSSSSSISVLRDEMGCLCDMVWVCDLFWISIIQVNIYFTGG